MCGVCVLATYPVKMNLDFIGFFQRFFVTDSDSLTLISGSYDLSLVALSVFLASMASFFALRMAATARHIVASKYRQIALCSGAFIMAGGIWSMHFVGMLAFEMRYMMEYDWVLTGISVLPAVLASYIVLRSLIKKRDSLGLTIRNAFIVGSGIGAMHYIGMEAMEMDLTLRYDPWWFILSVVVAVGLAFVALTARRVLRQYFPDLTELRLKLICAAIMGSAISGMHYTGMHAARFIEVTHTDDLLMMPHHHNTLALLVAVFTLLISTLAVNISAQLRYRHLLSEKTAGEARLQAILETATDGVITIKADGEILGLNRAASHILGWNESEALGQNVAMFMIPEMQQRHQVYFEQHGETGLASMIGVQREVYARHRFGEHIPVRLGVGKVELENETLFVGFMEDITERKAMQEKLRESEERLSSLMQNIPGASFRRLPDAKLTPIFLSDGITDLCGYSADIFLSGELKYPDLLLPEDYQKICDIMQHTPDGRDIYEIEYRLTNIDRDTVWVLENGMIVRDAEKRVLWIDGVVVDITSRKQMECELVEAKRHAEDAAEMKAAFLANMSHEIRTPMNAIIGFTDILLESETTGENRRHLQTISQSSRSLLHLLNDILDSAKLEKHKLEIETVPFRLSPCVDTVISTLWLNAKSKGIELELDMAAELPEEVQGAEDRIRQVLMNLVGNGIKFTEQGRVSLVVEPVSERPDWVRFNVIDTGIGIAPDRLQAIFDPFTQADASMSRRFGGTGLGTSISKQLVELMGGTISVTSTPGQGSCFSVELPLPRGKVTENTRQSKVLALPPKRILVCDDIEQNINLLRILLERQGHTVFTAQDGREAVIQCQETRPDVVLMDIQMPNLDGLEASRTIRAHERETGSDNVAIIALTASVLLEDRIEAKEAGMDGFANKPVDFALLTQEIARVLNLSAEELQAAQKKEPSVSSPSEFQMLNMSKALKIWGDEALYCQELHALVGKYADVVQELTALFSAGKWRDLGEKAHALKGLTGNLALLPLFHAFSHLEKAADQHQPVQCKQAIEEIAKGWLTLRQDVDQLDIPVADNLQSEGEAAIEDHHAITTILHEWLQATQLGELRDDLAAQLQRSSPNTIKKQIVDAMNAIDEFDFKSAVSSLESAIDTLQ